jgi:hypothetical protein
MSNDDRHSRILVFAIPIHKDWADIARQPLKEILLSLEHGTKKLPAEWLARGEMVLRLADELKRQGVEHPTKAAWELIGYANPREFAAKRRAGEPLGDLSNEALRKHFRALVNSRVRSCGGAGKKDAEQAGWLGLFKAREEYKRASDVGIGIFAKKFYLIDQEIKRALYGKKTEIPESKLVEGDAELGQSTDAYSGNIKEGGTAARDKWETIAGTLYPAWLENVVGFSLDARERPSLNRFPIVVRDQLETRRFPFWLQLWLSQVGQRPKFVGYRYSADAWKWTQENLANRVDGFLSYGGELWAGDQLIKVGKPLADYPKDRPIRRPMQNPPEPRQLKSVRHCSPDSKYWTIQ